MGEVTVGIHRPAAEHGVIGRVIAARSSVAGGPPPLLPAALAKQSPRIRVTGKDRHSNS